jgi:hypothetical protein
MDKVKFLDLKPHFNFRYVYPDGTAIPQDGFIGIHNLIVERRDAVERRVWKRFFHALRKIDLLREG